MKKKAPEPNIEKLSTDDATQDTTIFSCGIKNAGCSCYLNCLLQIITNYPSIFQQILDIEPNKDLETHLYKVIQKLMQSDIPISANFFSTG